jgi:Spy/CpxP family protein refolding chaperone
MFTRSLFVVASLGISSILFAQAADRQPPAAPQVAEAPYRMGMMAGFVKDLDLNDEQKAKFGAIAREVGEHFMNMRPQQNDVMKSLVEEFKKDQMDPSVFDAAMRAGEQRRAEIMSFMRGKLVQLHGMLTPEQRAKAAEKISGLMSRASDMLNGRSMMMHGKRRAGEEQAK